MIAFTMCFGVCNSTRTSPSIQSRRPSAVAASVAAAVLLFSNPAVALISQEPCVAGEGPGCASIAEDSPIIRELQSRSRQNKQKNEEDAREKYWQEGYGGYFKFSVGKELVKDPETGQWSLRKPGGIAKAIRDAGIIPEWVPY